MQENVDVINSRIFPSVLPGQQVRVVLGDEAKKDGKVLIISTLAKRKVPASNPPTYYQYHYHRDGMKEYASCYFPEGNQGHYEPRNYSPLTKRVVLYASDWEFLNYAAYLLGMINGMLADTFTVKILFNLKRAPELAARMGSIIQRWNSGGIQSEQIKKIITHHNVRAETTKMLYLLYNNPSYASKLPPATTFSSLVLTCAGCNVTKPDLKHCSGCKAYPFCCAVCDSFLT